jgi:hypothetical protein
VHRFMQWLRDTRTPLHIAFARPWPTTRRGLALWLFSIAFIVIGGVNYIATDLPDPTRESLAFALSVAPAAAWGWTMVLLGLFSAYCSYCHLGRDRLGFVLLATFCGGWALGFLCGLLFFDAPLRALGGSIVWWLFCVVLVAIAGFPSVPLHRSDVAAIVCHPGEDDR